MMTPPPLPPGLPLDVVTMLRRTAELALEKAEHECRKAKAEADTAEVILAHVKRQAGTVAFPKIGGGSS